MTPEEYLGRCRGLAIEAGEGLPVRDLDWVMHLIDHGEPAEGLASLAWSMETRSGPIAPEVAGQLRELIGDFVPAESLPPSLRHSTECGEGGESGSELK